MTSEHALFNHWISLILLFRQSQVETLPVRSFFLALRRRAAKRLQIRIYGMAHFNESAEYWGNTRDKIFDRNRLTARSVKIFADG